MKTSRTFRQIVAVAAAAMLLTALPAPAQQPGAFTVPAAEAPLGSADLETLVGPVALYADDLIGIVLPASTYPLQIVQAGRFLDDLEADDSLQPDPNWDDSVVALLNYPEVLRMMDANIEWTWALGEAVLDQQPAVLDAIQAFRGRALAAGNLASNDQQIVTENDGLIEIAPAEPEVIYIPYYEPERVVVVQPAPVIHYYTRPYPVYYYPYPIGYTFWPGYFWGVTSAFHIGWHSHLVHVYHHHHYAHPYYGSSYYRPYYARHSVNVSVNYTNYAWQPRHRYAGRPRRTETGLRTVASTEGRSPDLRNANYDQLRTRTQSRTTTRGDGARTFAQRAPNAAQTRTSAATRQAAPVASASSPTRAAAAAPTQRSATQRSGAQRELTGSGAAQRGATPSATQRSYAGRTTAAGAPTFSPSRSVQPSRSLPSGRGVPTNSGVRQGANALPGRSVQPSSRSVTPGVQPPRTVQPVTPRSQPSAPSSLGQRKAFGYERASAPAASGGRSAPAVRQAPSGAASRGAAHAAPRASASGGRTRSQR